MSSLLSRLSRRSLRADVLWFGIIGLLALGLFLRGEFTRDRTDEIRVQVRETVEQVNQINRERTMEARAVARKASRDADAATTTADNAVQRTIRIKQFVQGRRGRTGIGTPGSIGRAGLDALPGPSVRRLPGPEGMRGEPGTGLIGSPGRDGTDGEDASPPSPEQIAQAQADYCAARDACRGPQGDPGSPGMDSTVPGPAGPQGPPPPPGTVLVGDCTQQLDGTFRCTLTIQ